MYHSARCTLALLFIQIIIGSQCRSIGLRVKRQLPANEQPLPIPPASLPTLPPFPMKNPLLPNLPTQFTDTTFYVNTSLQVLYRLMPIINQYVSALLTQATNGISIGANSVIETINQNWSDYPQPSTARPNNR